MVDPKIKHYLEFRNVVIVFNPEVTWLIFRSRVERSGGADADLDERGVKVGGVGQLDSNRENMALMTEALRDREEHIEQLQEKVKQASR